MSIRRKTKMTYLRKAWSLTEMFVILFLLAVLMLLMARPTKTIIHRIPYIQADIQTNRVLLSVLDSIRKDVAVATDIEVTVTRIPVEMQKYEQVILDDSDFDPNILPLPAEPNEPDDLMSIELIAFSSSYFSTDVFADGNSIVIDAEPNIAEVVNDANLQLAMSADVNDLDVEPINTMTTLIVKTDTSTIRYEFANGIAKRIAEPAELVNDRRPNVWHIPKARLDMRIWQESEKPSALEIATVIVRKIEGRTRDTMSNAHVFFVKEQTR